MTPARPLAGPTAPPLRPVHRPAAPAQSALRALAVPLGALAVPLTALAVLLATLAVPLAAPVAAPAGAAPLQARRPGEEVVIADCLRVAVLGLTDRNGPLDPVDWVTLKVTNACSEPVRHLQVILVLEDVFGKAYGVRTWLLERGEVLMPGQSKTDRYAVPDPADHLPRRWAVRLHHVEKPSDRRRQAEPPATAGPDANAAATAALVAAAAAARQGAVARRAPARKPAEVTPRPAPSPTVPQSRPGQSRPAPSRDSTSPRSAPSR